MGVLRLTPAVSYGPVAVNTKVAPSSTERLLLGVRLICPGKSGGPALVPPPQPLMLHKERIATANRKTVELRPAHAPLVKHCSGAAFRSHAGRTVE